MRCRKAFFILILALSLSLLTLVSITETPALALSGTMSPTFGFPGTEVTITGSGLQNYAGLKLYIYFGDYQVKSIEVSATGTFNDSFNVPGYITLGETYSVTVNDEYNTRLLRWEFIVAKAKIELDPREGKVGEQVKINGHDFEAGKSIRMYLSINPAPLQGSIGKQIITYEYIGNAIINANGDFEPPYWFTIPGALTTSSHKEDVHSGEYYIYATYYTSEKIVAVAKFIVIDGEIKLDPAEGTIGSEINISGEGLRNNQKITVRYDGENINILSGNTTTGSSGQFACTVAIPESIADEHIITVTDVSGNKPEARFLVKPKIIINPSSEVAGNTVNITGSGFAGQKNVTVTFEGVKVTSTPQVISTNRLGNIRGRLLVPPSEEPFTGKIVAIDDSFNSAEAQLTVLPIPPIPAAITLSPITSITSPGYVGMKLGVDGTRFAPDTTVTITYDNDKSTAMATNTDAGGNFKVTITIPPGTAGTHNVTATDDTNTLISAFTMESKAPPIPVLLLPKAADTLKAEVHFDWEDVTDPSGVTYTLQIASDADFANILLEKKGLNRSEYTVTQGENLEPTNTGSPYYWRVKAIDGAFNESDWTYSGLFFIGSSLTSPPSWAVYAWVGLGLLLLALIIRLGQKLIAMR